MTWFLFYMMQILVMYNILKTWKWYKNDTFSLLCNADFSYVIYKLTMGMLEETTWSLFYVMCNISILVMCNISSSWKCFKMTISELLEMFFSSDGYGYKSQLDVKMRKENPAKSLVSYWSKAVNRFIFDQLWLSSK